MKRLLIYAIPVLAVFSCTNGSDKSSEERERATGTTTQTGGNIGADTMTNRTSSDIITGNGSRQSTTPMDTTGTTQ